MKALYIPSRAPYSYPHSRTTLFVCVALFAFANASVVVLNDDNFEDMTQASTGSTTGHWFVKFYAPWCGHCKRLAPTWIELADKLEGVCNVAEVDATENQGLAERFQIKSYPTLLFFYDGKYVEYRGARTTDALITFVKEGYKDQDFTIVPAVPNKWLVMMENFGNKINIWLYQNPIATTLILIGCGTIFGIAITVLFYQIVGTKEYTEEAPDEDIVPEEDENKEKTD